MPYQCKRYQSLFSDATDNIWQRISVDGQIGYPLVRHWSSSVLPYTLLFLTLIFFIYFGISFRGMQFGITSQVTLFEHKDVVEISDTGYIFYKLAS